MATELVWLTASAARVDSGTKRDQIGRFAWKKGAILWVGPTALVDLNGHTVRHGVHWRDRKDQRGELRRRRWVIVARTPYVFVLAHELGHYFGLPHSRAPRSLMNKRSTPGRPGVRDWRFTRKEGQRVQRRLGQLRRAGTLTLLKRMPAIDPLSSPARH
ncbi:MAG: matrixin family metalloprotease [Myxococcales bacterium]|nr:matrixin family metalloprotease [Myxococcales bacterium]